MSDNSVPTGDAPILNPYAPPGLSGFQKVLNQMGTYSGLVSLSGMWGSSLLGYATTFTWGGISALASKAGPLVATRGAIAAFMNLPGVNLAMGAIGAFTSAVSAFQGIQNMYQN